MSAKAGGRIDRVTESCVLKPAARTHVADDGRA